MLRVTKELDIHFITYVCSIVYYHQLVLWAPYPYVFVYYQIYVEYICC